LTTNNGRPARKLPGVFFEPQTERAGIQPERERMMITPARFRFRVIFPSTLTKDKCASNITGIRFAQ
jgi:hypothetical protein